MDLTLQYQRAGREAIPPARRAAWHLRLCGLLLLLFTVVLACVLVGRLVVHWRVSYVWARDPAAGMVVRPRYAPSYYWPGLYWVAAFSLGPLVLAISYWFLGGALRRRADRALATVAMILTTLHALTGSLFLMLFLMVGVANLRFRQLSFSTVLTSGACLLGMAIVVYALFISERLMALLKDGRRPPESV